MSPMATTYTCGNVVVKIKVSAVAQQSQQKMTAADRTWRDKFIDESTAARSEREIRRCNQWSADRLGPRSFRLATRESVTKVAIKSTGNRTHLLRGMR